MALDIAAGVIVLLASIRGFRRGFLAQAIGLAALVACVYAADPIRHFALPYAQAKFPDDPGSSVCQALVVDRRGPWVRGDGGACDHDRQACENEALRRRA